MDLSNRLDEGNRKTVRIKEKKVRDSQVSRIAGYWWPGRTWTGLDQSLVKLGV